MTISKRNGKYYCRFQIDGERHHYLCVGAEDEKQARKIETQFMYKIQQQQNGVIPKDMVKFSLYKLFQIYLEYALNNKKSYSQDRCRVEIMKQYFKSKGKNYIQEIKPKDIEDFKIYFLNEKQLSKTTVNRYLEILSKIFNIAKDNEWIIKNPIKGSMKFPVKNYTIRYLSSEEEDRMFKACPDYFKPILITALNTGLRKTNIRLLKWNNINLDYRLIELTENKGNKHIKLYINDELLELFNKMNKDGDYVFINPSTKRIYSDSSMKLIWHEIQKKAHLEDFRFHDLRHTVGTRLAEKGIPVPVIREVLAHSDVRTTMRYVHAVPKQIQSAMNVLNSYH